MLNLNTSLTLETIYMADFVLNATHSSWTKCGASAKIAQNAAWNCHVFKRVGGCKQDLLCDKVPELCTPSTMNENLQIWIRWTVQDWEKLFFDFFTIECVCSGNQANFRTVEHET